MTVTMPQTMRREHPPSVRRAEAMAEFLPVGRCPTLPQSFQWNRPFVSGPFLPQV